MSSPSQAEKFVKKAAAPTVTLKAAKQEKEVPYCLLESIQKTAHSAKYCSCTHIGKGRVLTAAHCLPETQQSHNIRIHILDEKGTARVLPAESVLSKGDIEAHNDSAIIQTASRDWPALGNTKTFREELETATEVIVTGFQQSKNGAWSLLRNKCQATHMPPGIHRTHEDGELSDDLSHFGDFFERSGRIFLVDCKERNIQDGFSGALIQHAETGNIVGLYNGLESLSFDSDVKRTEQIKRLQGYFLSSGEWSEALKAKHIDFLFGYGTGTSMLEKLL